MRTFVKLIGHRVMKKIIATSLLGLSLAAGGLRADPEQAIFAGGCFWCMEADFEKQTGVLSAVSGYTGGHLENPDYKQVTQGNTGHYEAVLVRYDPAQVSYTELLTVFWRNIDPFDDRGQFCDKGSSYRSAIFATPGTQTLAAEESKAEAQLVLGAEREIVTPVLPTSQFYPAEDYHQDYYKKNPLRYQYYRRGCGRDQRLQQLWGS
jgi:peptide-methionine (S)-S-oxide reductase